MERTGSFSSFGNRAVACSPDVRQTTCQPASPPRALPFGIIPTRPGCVSFHQCIPVCQVWNGFPRTRMSHRAGLGHVYRLEVQKLWRLRGMSHEDEETFGARALPLHHISARRAARPGARPARLLPRSRSWPSQRQKPCCIADLPKAELGTGESYPFFHPTLERCTKGLSYAILQT